MIDVVNFFGDGIQDLYPTFLQAEHSISARRRCCRGDL
jgi:hypothetical protein